MSSAPAASSEAVKVGSTLASWPFSLATFLSAFLLFQVQLIIGKLILPWFGGTPGVWTTCLLVFQLLLLAGYAYPHVTSRWMAGQGRLHLALLAATLVCLGVSAYFWRAPVLPGNSWRPTGTESPIVAIIVLLLAAVGLPFFVLSTTGPLLQRWHSRVLPGKSPYRLYAVSNAGSLAGLVTYPFFFERLLRLVQQAWLWTALFLAFAGLVGWCATRWMRNSGADAKPSEARVSVARPGWKTQALWVGLAASASTMLLAITNVICQEVAVIALLWVAPLCVYLLSFIICFEHERWYKPRLFHLLFAGAAVLLLAFNFTSLRLRTRGQIVAFLFVLFACCMVCHGELYRRRPNPQHLTLFYLHVSLGGVLGGLFVAVIAPHVFRGFWELQIGFLACAALLVAVLISSPTSWLRRTPPLVFATLRLVLIAALVATAAVFWTQAQVHASRNLWMGRNFYGTLRVTRFLSPDLSEDGYFLVHGHTAHGLQLLSPWRRMFPTLYYGPESGVGRLLTNFPRRQDEGLRLGLVGLGIGTLAAYGAPGDVLECYEINPLVANLAEGQGGYFSMLRGSRAKLSVVLGDGRLSLERQQPQGFDVLVFDVFNSDTIPVHILTREAIEVYLRHLRGPESVLAFHISSPVDLVPVLAGMADHFHLYAVEIKTSDTGRIARASDWVLMSRSPAVLQRPGIVEAAAGLGTKRVPLWTDDYSNLLPLLR